MQYQGSDTKSCIVVNSKKYILSSTNAIGFDSCIVGRIIKPLVLSSGRIKEIYQEQVSAYFLYYSKTIEFDSILFKTPKTKL